MERKTVNVKPEDVKTASACEWGIGQILQEIKLEKPGAGATRTWFSLWSPFGLGMHLLSTTDHTTYNLLSPWL